jgi:hypothetical protein
MLIKFHEWVALPDMDVIKNPTVYRLNTLPPMDPGAMLTTKEAKYIC